jgi:hypothetical protein
MDRGEARHVPSTMRRCSTRRLGSMDLFTAIAVELLGSRGYRARGADLPFLFGWITLGLAGHGGL